MRCRSSGRARAPCQVQPETGRCCYGREPVASIRLSGAERHAEDGVRDGPGRAHQAGPCGPQRSVGTRGDWIILRRRDTARRGLTSIAAKLVGFCASGRRGPPGQAGRVSTPRSTTPVATSRTWNIFLLSYVTSLWPSSTNASAERRTQGNIQGHPQVANGGQAATAAYSGVDPGTACARVGQVTSCTRSRAALRGGTWPCVTTEGLEQLWRGERLRLPIPDPGQVSTGDRQVVAVGAERQEPDARREPDAGRFLAVGETGDDHITLGAACRQSRAVEAPGRWPARRLKPPGNRRDCSTSRSQSVF